MEMRDIVIMTIVISGISFGLLSWQVSLYNYYGTSIDDKYNETITNANGTMVQYYSIAKPLGQTISGNTTAHSEGSSTEIANQQYATAAASLNELWNFGDSLSNMVGWLAAATGYAPDWVLGMLGLLIGAIILFTIISAILRYRL